MTNRSSYCAMWYRQKRFSIEHSLTHSHLYRVNSVPLLFFPSFFSLSRFGYQNIRSDFLEISLTVFQLVHIQTHRHSEWESCAHTWSKPGPNQRDFICVRTSCTCIWLMFLYTDFLLHKGFKVNHIRLSPRDAFDFIFFSPPQTNRSHFVGGTCRLWFVISRACCCRRKRNRFGFLTFALCFLSRLNRLKSRIYFSFRSFLFALAFAFAFDFALVKRKDDCVKRKSDKNLRWLRQKNTIALT